MQKRPTESRGRVKGGAFVPFHFPLWSPEAKPLVGSRGNAPWVTPPFVHPPTRGGWR